MSELERTWAVLIGVERYHESVGDLAGPARSAELFAQMLSSKGMPFGHIRLMTATRGDDRVTADEINRYLTEELPAKDGDRLVVYWAGHGIEHEQRQWLFYPDTAANAVPALDFESQLLPLLGSQGCRFAEQYFFVDACRTRHRGLQPKDFPYAVPKVKAGHRQHAILASASGAITTSLANEGTTFGRALLDILGELPFPWDMKAVHHQLRSTASLAPIQISWSAPDGTRDGRHGTAGTSDVGLLLDAAVPDAAALSRVVTALESIVHHSVGPVTDGPAVVEAIRRRYDTLLPLNLLVQGRSDLFPPSAPTTRDLLAALEKPVTAGQGRAHTTVRDILGDLSAGPSPQEAVVRQAFAKTLDVYAASDSSLRSSPPAYGKLGPAGTFLLEQAGLGIEPVLDFLERVAVYAPEFASSIRESCDELAGNDPELATELRRIRGRAERRRATLRSRPHLLVHIKRDMDSDPELSPEDQQFTVIGWSYVDEGTHPCPDTFGDCALWFPARGRELIEKLSDRLPSATEQHTVVELMVDDITLSDQLFSDVVDALTAKYLVVLRPDRSNDLPAWFRNWRRVLDGATLAQVELGEVPPTCPAVLLVEPPADRNAVEALRQKAIPVMVWNRKGVVDDVSGWPRHTSFHTPEDIDKIRRAASPTVDPALIWHNPYWFPAEDGTLSWRNEVTA